MANDYSQLSKEELLEVIKKLESHKKYGLIWDEERTKEHFENEAEDALPILKEVKSKEIKSDPSKPVNILIEGDNYHALSVLNYTHHGRVDLIYIDPPYNTGARDWKYNNDYVDENDTWRHSKWLSFMNNRLKLVRRLLNEDSGVLVCTIDHNEQEALGLLLQDLFGDKEITCVTIVHNPGGIQGDNFSYTHEYAYFVYPRKKRMVCLHDREDDPDIRPLRDVSTGEHLREDAANCFYPIYVKDEKIIGFGDVCADSFHPKSANVHRRGGVVEIYPIDPKGNERKWVFSRNNVESILDELSVQYNKRRKLWDIIRTKTRFNYKTVWTDRKFNANIYGTKLLRQIIDTDFPYPKSLYAVKECLNAAVSNKPNAIVLDFFAGSGTTGHAVLEMNKLDDGNRTFILCTNNENNICTEACYPRIKNVIRGYKCSGKTKELLFEKKATVSVIRKCEKLKTEIELIYKNNISKFDELEPEVADNYVRIYGIKETKGRKEGLGGNLKYFRTSFVKRTISKDSLKIRITRECTEMLCLREGIFDEIKKTDDYRIFQHNDRIMGVYYSLRQDKLKSLKKDLDKTKGKKILYCFTLDPLGLDKHDFRDWKGVSLEPIPQKILDIYEGIYEY
ncbi:MAG: site-specific DNA-methyltransferase [Planctomycetes bacterium]|nr:site-specific DNA-methyltransferase [Planctomycetota bacterium]